MPTAFLGTYLDRLKTAFDGINAKEFQEFIHELISAFEKDSHIFICGNGGSGSTASHFVCDINKGVSYGKEKRYKMICLNDNIPTLLAYANDVSYEDVFVEQLKNFMKEGDLVIGVSGSGNSRNVLKTMEYANKNGGKTFGLCGYGGGKLKHLTHKSLVIHSHDMQNVEDLHMIVFHCTMQYLCQYFDGSP